METTTTELSGSRVRIDVGVPAGEVRSRVLAAAVSLAGEVRVPGFRKGKTPPEIVVQRLGWAAVMEQALREALPEWYERALIDSGAPAVGEPKLDVPSLPAEGEPLAFSIEVAVRPAATLGDYRGLEVGRAEARVAEQAIDEELVRLREGFASLHPVERAAQHGDFLLVDYVGEADGEPIEGAEAQDFLLELGSEALLAGFDEGLAGAAAGEEREVQISFPEDYRPERLAGVDATFKVTVKEVREKRLPDLDDDFAADASEFDTLEELRGDLTEKIGQLAERRVDEQFREAAVDAAVDAARIELPDAVVGARAEEIWSRVERSLQARGIEPESYLRMQGKSREELLAEARPDAEQGLKREAVLAAVADAEGIEIADEDLRLRKAAEVVAEAANPIPLEQAEARERIWTPEKEREEKGSLWTPGEGPA